MGMSGDRLNGSLSFQEREQERLRREAEEKQRKNDERVAYVVARDGDKLKHNISPHMTDFDKPELKDVAAEHLAQRMVKEGKDLSGFQQGDYDAALDVARVKERIEEQERAEQLKAEAAKKLQTVAETFDRRQQGPNYEVLGKSSEQQQGNVAAQEHRTNMRLTTQNPAFAQAMGLDNGQTLSPDNIHKRFGNPAAEAAYLKQEEARTQAAKSNVSSTDPATRSQSQAGVPAQAQDTNLVAQQHRDKVMARLSTKNPEFKQAMHELTNRQGRKL